MMATRNSTTLLAPPRVTVAMLHMLIERPDSADAHGVRAFVGLSREACRELGKALLRIARARR